jgi:hypothetical protein
MMRSDDQLNSWAVRVIGLQIGVALGKILFSILFTVTMSGLPGFVIAQSAQENSPNIATQGGRPACASEARNCASPRHSKLSASNTEKEMPPAEGI